MKDDILEDLSTEEMEDIVEHINRVCGNFWIDLTEEYIAFHQNKDMDIKDKLRLAICMSQSKWSGLIYNTKDYYERFDSMLKDIDEEYRTTLINFGKI